MMYCLIHAVVGSSFWPVPATSSLELASSAVNLQGYITPTTAEAARKKLLAALQQGGHA
jgi:hypothetical protein